MINETSNPIVGTSLLGAQSQLSSSGKGTRDTPEAITKAASQFESLLIGEVMKSAREANGSGWLGTDEDEAGSTLMDLSEQQISQALASGGGLGLAKMISGGLADLSSKSSGTSASIKER